MKRLIALAIVIFASQAVTTFGGEPVGSSTQVTRPSSFFRPNEFDTGAFGTFVTGLGSGANAGKHALGGGLDSTYWSPWKYAGVRFQGTGATSR
jgi:hypothetical protein